MLISIRPRHARQNPEIKFYWNQLWCEEPLEGRIRPRKDKACEVDKSVTQISIRDFLEFRKGNQVLVTQSRICKEYVQHEISSKDVRIIRFILCLAVEKIHTRTLLAYGIGNS